MMSGLRRATRNPLSAWRRSGRKLSVAAPPAGLTHFRIGGIVDGEAVQAVWDGAALSLDEPLYTRALLSEVVDDIFVEEGLMPARHRSTLRGTPREVALTLARSCDVVDTLEYTRRGIRRMISDHST
jgi:hypothetical protein